MSLVIDIVLFDISLFGLALALCVCGWIYFDDCGTATNALVCTATGAV
jgi:hypothetical protein